MLLLFGALLILLGFAALGSTVMTSFLTVYFLSIILIIGGIGSFFYGIFGRKTDKTLYIVQGIIGFIIGLIMFNNPAISLGTLALLMGIYFLFGGMVWVVISLVERYANWGWSVVGGVISVLLGLAVLAQWPLSGLMLIGIVVGVQLIVLGSMLVAGHFITKGETTEYMGTSKEQAAV